MEVNINGILYQPDYKPRFSGHETFPLRYGWLKKAFDRVQKMEGDPNNRSDCWGEKAIAEFGVGKNMVASIRHWANVTNIIDENDTNSVRTTGLGKLIFKPRGGYDPYLEHPTTLWLLHWKLATNEDKTTWVWAFNYYPTTNFDKDGLIGKINRLVRDRVWYPVAESTIKKDVACFIRTYVAQQPSGKIGHDDALESPLTELGLIRPNSIRDSYRFVRGSKPMLGQGIFTYALIDFWSRYAPNTTTLSFETIAHAPGSPGRVFLLDETDIDNKLTALDTSTGGLFRQTETAGLKQITCGGKINTEVAQDWLLTDYYVSTRKGSRNGT